MAFSYVASASSSSSSGTVTVNKPTGTTDNDLMFCHVATKTGSLGTTLSGWTLLQSIANGTRHAVYYKKASSEGASYAWTGFSDWTSVMIHTFRGGFDLTTPILLSNKNQDSTNTTLSCSLGTISSTNSPIIFITGLCSGTTETITKDATPISGWTTNYSAKVDSVNAHVSSVVWSSSGSFGNITATIDKSINGLLKGSFAISLTPLSSGPANLKSYNTNLKANIKTINTNPIANVKSLNTNV